MRRFSVAIATLAALVPLLAHAEWSRRMGTSELVDVEKVDCTVAAAFMEYAGVTYGSNAFLDRYLVADLTGVTEFAGGVSTRTEWKAERFLDVEALFRAHRAKVASGSSRGPEFLVLDGQYGRPLWLKEKDDSREEVGGSVKDYLGVTWLPSSMPSTWGLWIVPGLRLLTDTSFHVHAAAMVGLRVGKTRHAVGVNPRTGEVRRNYQQAWWLQTDLLFYGPAWGPGFEAELALSFTLGGALYGGYFALVSQYFPAFADMGEYGLQTDLAQAWAASYVGLRLGLQFFVPH